MAYQHLNRPRHRPIKDSVPFAELLDTPKHRPLVENLKGMGYAHATTAQVASIRLFLQKGDVSNAKMIAPSSESDIFQDDFSDTF